jgi:hypothetical protein
LEGWEDSLFWYTWDQSVRKEVTRGQATVGRQALKVFFDLSQYAWPSLFAPLYPSKDLRAKDKLSVDVYLPKELNGNVSITTVIEARESHSAPATQLKPGWNRVVADLNGTWLPKEARRAAKTLQWIVSSKNKRLAGWVVFDNLRFGVASRSTRSVAKRVPSNSELLESWEGKLLWGAYNEEVKQEITTELVKEGSRGLKLTFDFEKFNRPVLYVPLNPTWNLKQVDRLTADIYAPAQVAGVLQVRPILVSKGARYLAPPINLKTGWNKAVIELNGEWLSEAARQRVEQLQWLVTSVDKNVAGWLVFDNLRTENN